MSNLYIYNTLSRKKEEFIPLHPPHVGLYVCGPTVYGDAHLGHARPAITFDLLFRYLKVSGYKVRYVRNITDVGHLENDADAGEDKVAKKARLEQVEPMEVVHFYLNQYHELMRRMNVLPPGIEPMASGHIIEQQAMVRKILQNGYAYESGGSVYFDVQKYNSKHEYGKLSGRKIEDLLSNTRKLEGQDGKRSPLDFAIWKKADEQHIMKWPSDWGEGFPGWHLECSAMSAKYLGETFDIHGGGLDLLFPHHECEIAQSVAANGKESVRYWMHNNMITINGQKMGRSLGNFITLEDIFSGQNKLLEQPFSPQTIRFFILQAHYRSPLDFSNDALKAAEKGLSRLMQASGKLEKLTSDDMSDLARDEEARTFNLDALIKQAHDAMNDDLNSPLLIAALFDGVKWINTIVEGKATISKDDLEKFQAFFKLFLNDILGLKDEEKATDASFEQELIETILQIRQDAKGRKDFATSDQIRDALSNIGIIVKDRKDGYDWKRS